MHSYIYASYIDDPIALINSNGKYFYHSNNQFSIGAITDSVGNLTERLGYNAFGKPIAITDSVLVNNNYFFTGRQFDTETGLFYFRARYYDANLGQFISRDPVGYIDGMNLYSGYFAINKLDFTGTYSTFKCAAYIVALHFEFYGLGVAAAACFFPSPGSVGGCPALAAAIVAITITLIEIEEHCTDEEIPPEVKKIKKEIEDLKEEIKKLPDKIRKEIEDKIKRERKKKPKKTNLSSSINVSFETPTTTFELPLIIIRQEKTNECE